MRGAGLLSPSGFRDRGAGKERKALICSYYWVTAEGGAFEFGLDTIKEMATKKRKPKMTFDDWMEFGIKQGWCTAPVCLIHDGEPTTAEEDAEFADGSDPCIHIIRMCEDGAHQKAVLENHSPSNWRDHYTTTTAKR